MRPTIRQLEYLVAVADERHFGRAARACAVSQPGLSAQIQQLEDILGVQLFERSRRGVLLTPAGERVVERARDVLRATDELVQTAEGVGRPLEGPLRLGVIPTVAPYVLPHLVPKVRRAHPKLSLILREDQTERLVDQLRAGELDLLLLALPIDGPDLEERAVFEDPFVLLAPKEHALASGGRAHSDDLAGATVLLLDEGHCLRDQALDVCNAASARESETVRATSMNTLVQMVANGLGVTLLPASAVPVEVKRARGLAVRPFVRPEPSRTIGLVWRRSTGRREAFERIEAILREVVPQIEGSRLVKP